MKLLVIASSFLFMFVVSHPISLGVREIDRGGANIIYSYLIKFGYITSTTKNRYKNTPSVTFGGEQTILNPSGIRFRENPNSFLEKKNNLLTQGILNLQKESGIAETGVVDADTIAIINTPRCGVVSQPLPNPEGIGRRLPFGQTVRGVPSLPSGASHFEVGPQRAKRFTILEKWKTSTTDQNETLVYWYLDLSNYDKVRTNLSKEVIYSVFSTAFSMWSKTSLLLAKETLIKNNANIVIKFESKDHGDRFAFDGEGGVLAHAFYPGSEAISGDAHFDLEEKWSLYTNEARSDEISLFYVALHELGHSLGIGHSSQNSSIMYAWYKPHKMRLSEDDVFAINDLYGVRPFYKFGPITPKHTKYDINKLKKIFIQDSQVYIYPKSSTTLTL